MRGLFEMAKLRMLNAAHSALAYIGLATGHEFVSEAIADPRIGRLVKRLMLNEAQPTIMAAPEQDLAAYADALIARFANRAIQHRLAQIAMDGSQKIVPRWLATLAAHGDRDADCDALLTALAAWIVHVRGDDGQVCDPQAAQLAALWQRAGVGGIIDALFGEGGQFARLWQPSSAAKARLQQLLHERTEVA